MCLLEKEESNGVFHRGARSRGSDRGELFYNWEEEDLWGKFIDKEW